MFGYTREDIVDNTAKVAKDRKYSKRLALAGAIALAAGAGVVPASALVASAKPIRDYHPSAAPIRDYGPIRDY